MFHDGKFSHVMIQYFPFTSLAKMTVRNSGPAERTRNKIDPELRTDPNHHFLVRNYYYLIWYAAYRMYSKMQF